MNTPKAIAPTRATDPPKCSGLREMAPFEPPAVLPAEPLELG